MMRGAVSSYIWVVGEMTNTMYSPTSPYRSKTGAADQLIESSGRTKIVTLENAVPYELFP